jgi:hypothetical protein
VACVAVDGGSQRRDLPIEGSVGVASPSRTTPPAGTPIARTELAIRITIVANMPGRRRCSGPRRRHPTCAEMVRADRVKEGRCSGNVLDGQALPEARAVRRGRAALQALARHHREGARPKPPHRRHGPQQPRRAVSEPDPLTPAPIVYTFLAWVSAVLSPSSSGAN